MLLDKMRNMIEHYANIRTLTHYSVTALSLTGIAHRELSNSPVRHQSTQQPGNKNEVHRPDFPVSPVPVLSELHKSDAATVVVEPVLELNSPQSSAGEVNKYGHAQSESTPKKAKQQEGGICVGSYFAAGISPPLVMPSTSHFSDVPTSPTDLHSPVHPPARSSSSTYFPLLKKSSTIKHSPPRKSPNKAIPSTSRSIGIVSKPKTPARKERQETMAEENRLAILSGRKQRMSVEDREDAQSVSSVGTVQIVSSGRDLDIDPVAMDEEEKKVAELRRATSGMEIMAVKLTDISPKERKLQRRPTLEITALSPKKLNKFSSRSSSESDGASISSNSSQQLKTFSIGKKRNKLDISLKLVEDLKGKRTISSGPKQSKSKTPAKKKGDISVLFASPDRLKKSASDPKPLSPDGSMIRKRKRKLYNDAMLMPVDEDASQNSTSQGNSDSQSSGVQSTAGSDLLLISNSSSESNPRTISGKQKPSKSDEEVVVPAKRKTKGYNQRKSDNIEDYNAGASITREEGRRHKERFIRETSDKLSPTLQSKLKCSPRVNIPNMDKARLTPSYDLTAAQRSRRSSKTRDTHETDANSDSDWTLPFSLSRGTKLSGATSRKPHASNDGASLLLVSTFCLINSQFDHLCVSRNQKTFQGEGCQFDSMKVFDLNPVYTQRPRAISAKVTIKVHHCVYDGGHSDGQNGLHTHSAHQSAHHH